MQFAVSPFCQSFRFCTHIQYLFFNFIYFFIQSSSWTWIYSFYVDRTPQAALKVIIECVFSKSPWCKLLQLIARWVSNVVCWLFSKLTFSKNSFTNTIRVSNSFDLDQNRRYVGPDLGPNCLQRLTEEDKVVAQQGKSSPSCQHHCSPCSW